MKPHATSLPVNEFGMTEPEMHWVATRAAKLMAQGIAPEAAVGQALADLGAFLREIADGATDRAKAVRSLIARRVWTEVRADDAARSKS